VATAPVVATSAVEESSVGSILANGSLLLSLSSHNDQ
jgi:hypothetical protein